MSSLAGYLALAVLLFAIAWQPLSVMRKRRYPRQRQEREQPKAVDGSDHDGER